MNGFSAGEMMIDIIAQQAPWAALAIARPFGFTLVFYAFAWGHLNSGILRMAFAFAIAAPTFASGIPAQSAETLDTFIVVLLVKELFLGTVLGFLASAPLAMAMGGGGIVDMYRGAFLGGPDPAGGETPAIANLFVVVSLWTFAALGGFWLVAQLLYSSYAVWPAPDPMPAFKPDMMTLWKFLGGIILSALVLAGPLLALMFFSDIIHLISAKLGKQINVSFLAFSSKNLVLVAVLPVFLIYAQQVLTRSHEGLPATLRIMQAVFE